MNHRTLAFLLLAALLLGGLYRLLQPRPDAAPPATAAARVSPAPAALRHFELRLQHGRRVAGPDVLRVSQGETVVLRVTSDHADELHLHGYDLALPLPAGVPTTLRFTADRSGRFEYELHHAQRDLGALEVQPRP